MNQLHVHRQSDGRYILSRRWPIDVLVAPAATTLYLGTTEWRFANANLGDAVAEQIQIQGFAVVEGKDFLLGGRASTCLRLIAGGRATSSL
ncbi:hypothetical protein [Noviluteimonas gilva]|uniref:Uncharacterized protein n=1 Tax=Noviluteimonas gilva TaxID=2682097 RepID=A0A7C9HVU1_9GAMM|nr:hypothetical protein [Lysobacter gilvus]MUV14698.1 hypothetical protein [Lysobacter gilvus]